MAKTYLIGENVYKMIKYSKNAENSDNKHKLHIFEKKLDI